MLGNSLNPQTSLPDNHLGNYIHRDSAITCFSRVIRVFAIGPELHTPFGGKANLYRFRTDTFFVELSEYAGGNNQKWNPWARDQLGITQLLSEVIVLSSQADTFIFLAAAEAQFKKLSGFVNTQYVRNRGASSSFIYGPHGWVHPSGLIAFVDNAGKWPSASDIFEDWGMLAKAFPFLDLTVT